MCFYVGNFHHKLIDQICTRLKSFMQIYLWLDQKARNLSIPEGLIERNISFLSFAIGSQPVYSDPCNVRDQGLPTVKGIKIFTIQHGLMQVQISVDP